MECSDGLCIVLQIFTNSNTTPLSPTVDQKLSFVTDYGKLNSIYVGICHQNGLNYQYLYTHV